MDNFTEMIIALETAYAERQVWFEWMELIAVAFIGLAILELGWDLVSKTGRKVGETFANIGVAVGYEITGLVTNAVVIGITYFLIQPYALFQIEMTPLTWVAAFLLADFLYYWMHRFEHEVRILWAHHVAHHSSPEFDLTTAFRLSWMENLVEWIFLVPMLLIGFDAVTTFVAIAANATYQTWLHTQKIGKLGFLESIINTPSAHRVHHGSNSQYLDKNYGGILMIWDRMFGTYEPEEEKVVYGITEPIKSINPFVINFHEYGAILKDCFRAGNWRDRRQYLFGHPGWKPEAPEHIKAAPDKAA